jgi:hypothetical protein
METRRGSPRKAGDEGAMREWCGVTRRLISTDLDAINSL